MSVLKIKDANGDWQDIPAIKGADGAIQYTAGTNIQIADDTISTTALNQTQVQNLIDASIQALGDLGFTPTVVQELPVSHIDTHTIYLVPKNGSTGDVYDEYLYINNNWEHIGSTEVDLSNYYTKTEVDNKISIPIITILPAQMTSLTTCQFTAEQRVLLDDNKYGIYYMVGHNIGLADGVIYKSMAYTENNVDYINFTSVYENSSIVKSLRGLYNKSTGVGTFSIHEILTTSNTTSYTPSGDYNPATKKYVDDAAAAIASGDYPKVFYLYNDNKYEVPTSGSDTNATRMTQVSQFITDAINNNIRPQLIFVCNNTYVESLSDFGERQVCSYTMKTNPTQKTSYVFRSDEQWIHKYVLGKASTFSTYGSGKYYQRYTLTITGSWSDNAFTATSISFGYENCNLNQMLPAVSTVLTRDNEDAYTPTADYHPATKKYVDDLVGNINTVLATLTTPQGGNER